MFKSAQFYKVTEVRDYIVRGPALSRDGMDLDGDRVAIYSISGHNVLRSVI